MPWKDSSLPPRLQFIRAASTETNLSALCRQFGISRPTAYKWLLRYHQEGSKGMRPRSKRPKRSPQKYRLLLQKRVFTLRHRHPTWGARKLLARLQRLYPRTRRWPARRTLDRWLRTADLSRRAPPRKRAGPLLKRTPLTAAQHPNHVWTLDFKGWFRTADGTRCDILTVRDLFSRYLLDLRILPKLDDPRSRRALARVFHRYGLPQIIRVDNGAPFAGKGARQLSRLSLWWLRLGIHVEFIRPAKPQDNAGHEQMHSVLKAEIASPPAPNRLAQQRRCDRWIEIYNHVRPHQSLDDRVPANLYRPSLRRLKPPLLSTYPAHWLVRRVRANGWIKFHGRLRFIGRAFVHQSVGLKQLTPQIHEIYLDHFLLGTLHHADGSGSLRPCTFSPQHSHSTHSVNHLAASNCKSSRVPIV